MDILLDKIDTTDTFTMDETVILTCKCGNKYEWMYPRTMVSPGKFRRPKPQYVCPPCQAQLRIDRKI